MRSIKYQTEIKRAGPGPLKIWLAVPRTNYLQTIGEVVIDPQPHFSYDDKENSIVGWQAMVANFNLTLDFDYSNNFAKQEIDPNICTVSTDESLQKYLNSEQFLEQTEAVVKLAKKIVSHEAPYAAVEKIFDWVVKNFQYEYPPAKRGAENLDLENLRGDCGEYSSLFVVLCRAVGIPTKVDVGFFLTEAGEAKEHAWASVHLEPHGWLPVDCQFASLEEDPERGKEQYFLNMPEDRIIFTSGFNIPLRPSLSSEDDLTYWQDQSLPLGSDWVQTLQPLIFITAKNNPAEFSQKFEIRKK